MKFKSPLHLIGLCAALLSTLASAPAQSETLISTNTAWHYLDDGSDQGTAWRSTAFDDSGWSNGVPLFGAEPSLPYPYPWPIRTPMPVGGRVTYYFRTHFNWSGSSAGVVLTASNYIDDGAIFYLNGVEAARVRLPSTPVTYTTRATNQAFEGTLDVVALPASSLVVGDNVIAVEVHHANPSGTDVIFGMTLAATAPTAPTTRSLFINEWLASNIDGWWDPMDGDHDDWFEIYNPGTNAVNLAGYFLTDTLTNQSKFQVPADYLLPAGGYLLVWADNEPQQNTTNFPHLHVNFTLATSGGYIGLSAPDGTALDAISFGVQTADVSEGRWPDGGTNRYFMARPTPGAANVLAPVVISEIMFQPPANGGSNNVLDEFIELRNLSADPVPLFDPAFPSNTWHLRTAVEFDFSANTVLPPAGYLLVVSFDPAANPGALASFRATYGVSPAVAIVGPYVVELDNSGGSLELFRPGTPVRPPAPNAGFVPYFLADEVEYSAAAPWPVGAGGTGASLQRRVDAEYGNDPGNWGVAAPTPGSTLPDPIPPSITSQPQSQTNVVGSSVTFSVTAIGTSPLSYQWLFNGTNIAGATNASYVIPSTLPSDAGSYVVLVTNAYGLAASAPAELRMVNINEGRLRCADGSPLANCVVTVEFWAGGSLAASYTATTDNAGFFFYYLSCSGVSGVQTDRKFVISASCCPNQTWTVPHQCCCGDLGILTCDNCVPPPACDPAHNLLVNGSFEKPVIGSVSQLPNVLFPDPVPGWSTACSPNGTGGLIEFWRNPFGGIPASDGLQHLEINGNLAMQTVCQTVTVCPNVPAALCFDYTGRYPSRTQNRFQVDVVDDTGISLFSSPPTFSPDAFGTGGWQNYSTPLPARPTLTLTIKFTSLPDTTTDGGAHIDNVILTQAPQRPAAPCNVTPGPSFSTNFDTSPAGMNLYGDVGVSSGVLKLTTANNWQFGVAVLPAFSVHSFRATFKLYIGGGGPLTGGIASADGFSFNLADDILPVSSSYGPSYEEGTGTGLTVSFDTYDNDFAGTADATGIFVKDHGNIIGMSSGGFQPSQGPTATTPGWKDVEILMDDCGNVKVFYNGQLRAAGHINYCPGPGARFALAARTGAGNDNHWVDDLVITTESCAPEITATAPAGSCFVDVTYDTPCFTGCGDFTVVCVPPSGSAFCVGTHRVCCTATDAAGNQGHCGFGVTVLGTITPPVFTFCPPSGYFGCNPPFLPGWGTPTATAACGTPVITSTLGTIITNGCHRSWTRTYTATDACGNTATCAQTLSWTEDTTPPVIIRCAANRTLVVNLFLCYAELPDMRSEVVATDNCSDVTVVQAPPAGSHLGDGVHEVVFTVCDACGNCVTCTNTVTVFSILLFCPADIAVDCQNDLGATVNYQIPTADSLCCGGPGSVSCVPPPGHFPIGVTHVVCTATDACGHAGQCSFTVTVRDIGCCQESGNLVNNGGFELPASAGGGAFLNNGSVSGWNGYVGACGSATAAPIELWDNGSILSQAGLQHLEISSSVANETVCQTVNNLTPGCLTKFCFWYTGRPGLWSNGAPFDNAFTVTLSGAYALTATLLPAPWPSPAPAVGGWYKYGVSFIPSGTSLTIAFGRNPPGLDVGGAHIDNVSLTQCCAPDADHDGLPDAWEIAHGLDRNNPDDAGLDADGDGMTNLQEYLAGTDPRDPGGVLRLRSPSVDPSGAVRIQFEAAPGHSYSVEAAHSLGGGWTAIHSAPAQPVARTVTVTVPNAGEAARFFRVRVE